MIGDRSMVYIEGEASMRKFQRDGEAEQNALSIVQRSCSQPLFFHLMYTWTLQGAETIAGNIEILEKRPHSSDEQGEPTPANEGQAEHSA